MVVVEEKEEILSIPQVNSLLILKASLSRIFDYIPINRLETLIDLQVVTVLELVIHKQA